MRKRPVVLADFINKERCFLEIQKAPFQVAKRLGHCRCVYAAVEISIAFTFEHRCDICSGYRHRSVFFTAGRW